MILCLRFSLFFVFTILIINTVYAELGQFSQSLITPEESTCSGSNERDLSARMGPTRNQGSTGWCFAYVAADLMSYKLGARVSAADTALSFYMQDPACLSFYRPAERLRGGWVAEAVTRSKRIGACLENNFRSDDVAYWAGEFPTQRNSLKALSCDQNSAVRMLFPGLSKNSVDEIYRRTGLADNFISKLANEACRPRIKTNTLQPVVYNNRLFAAPMFNRVDEQLRLNRPLGIAICAELLYNSNSRCTTQNHAVTVIGKRYNKSSRECEYLIRNSWGADICSDYDKKYSCNSRNGNVWIPKSILRRSMGHVTYIP